MYDVVTLGEILLRLAVPSPGTIETARQLDVQIGGAEANVAVACARLGARVAWLSALPANPWGERVRRELVGHGVVEVRGRGLWAGVDIDPTLMTGREMSQRLLRRGVLVKDTHGSTVRLAPPLVVEREEIDWAVEQVADALVRA